MDKKNHLLCNLKRQVIALKMQLQKLEKNKHLKYNKHSSRSPNHKSISHSSRFGSVSLDCSYLEKGIKKFKQHDSKSRNLPQLIHEKSAIDRVPTFCSQRKQEYQRTKENFSSEKPQYSQSRSRSPNPITGQGYEDKKKGIRTLYSTKAEGRQRPSEKRHFNLYY